MLAMTDFAPFIVGALVTFSILRAVLPGRVRLQREAGHFELQRPLGQRLLAVARNGFWIAVLTSFFLASLWSGFELGILVSGAAVVILVWRTVDQIWRSTVVVNRLQNRVQVGPRLIGRTSEVRAVVVRPERRAPLALIFRPATGGEHRWFVPGVDPASADAVGQQLAEYLGVPLESSW
jgi:hypothetical protein